jgi:hypothetical protein
LALVFGAVPALVSIMSHPVSDEQIATLSACIFEGRKIEAIKLHREMTGLGLKEAKDAVEELERSLRASAPDKFTAGPQAKGCLGVIVAGLLCGAGFVTYWLA